MSPDCAERSTGMPLPLRRNCLPVWAPSGIVTRAFLPSMVGTSISPPMRRDGHRDRHLAEQVGAVALEEFMRPDREENIEIARRAAAQARLALVGQPDARAVLDAGRNIDRQRALLGDAALAAASWRKDRR